MIPYARQNISDADIQAVIAVLTSDWLTQGPAVPRFEQAMAKYCGAAHALTTNSATSALHIACLALGLGHGDWLWTSPNTFVASANCALYCGASVDFVDIDRQTYNMSVDALKAKLEQAEKNGRLPKILVPVHFAGQSCDMQALRELANRYKFHIIEDASHAAGGQYLDKPVGSCQYSDITVFSFHPVKIITAGEGGMALTNDLALYQRMMLLRSHGITRDRACMSGEPDGAWSYEQIDLGFNFRMTDIHAALGWSQLQQLEGFIERRYQIADRYDAALRELPLQLPIRKAKSRSAFHLYVIWIKPDSGRSRREVFDTLRSKNIGVNVHYLPVHRQPYYRKLGFKLGDFPEAEKYYSGAISLPIYPGLSSRQQEHVIETLRACFADARAITR